MDNLLRFLGMEVKEKRKKLGLTQEKLAEATNISLPQISKIERGKANISLSSLEPIAAFLNMSVVDLISASQTNQTPEKLKMDVISMVLSLDLPQIVHLKNYLEKLLNGADKKSSTQDIEQQTLAHSVNSNFLA